MKNKVLDTLELICMILAIVFVAAFLAIIIISILTKDLFFNLTVIAFEIIAPIAIVFYILGLAASKDYKYRKEKRNE